MYFLFVVVVVVVVYVYVFRFVTATSPRGSNLHIALGMSRGFFYIESAFGSFKQRH